MLFPLSPSGGGSGEPRSLTEMCLDLGVRGTQASHSDVLGFGGQKGPGLSHRHAWNWEILC